MIRIFLRILYFIIIGWIIVKIVMIFREKKQQVKQSPFSRYNRQKPIIKNELVKDVYCDTYIPIEKALILNYEGQTFYFCCEECKEKYIALLKNKN